MCIGLDKSGYQVNTFLISRQKHMLWVLIRSASENICCGTSNEYPQHMFSLRNKKNIDTFWLKKAPYQELCICAERRFRSACTSDAKFLYADNEGSDQTLQMAG